MEQMQSQDQGLQDAYAPPQAAPVMSADDYYRTMVQPTQSNIDLAYQQALGRAPEQAGRDFWAGKAQELGWTGQELASQINSAAAAERGQTGYQGQANPQAFTQSRLGTSPSYYNTNPYAVDYQNIFNPQAGSVLRANPAMTPAQQAQYMSGWQQDYRTGVQRGLEQTKADRIAKADAAMKTYQTEKAKADSAAATKADIDKAIQEAMANYAPSTNNNMYYGGKKGGLATLKGFKR
jgi:hypothetical protein